MMNQNAYFSLLAHIKQVLLVIFCDMTAGIGNDTEQDAAGMVQNAVRADRREYWNSHGDAVLLFIRKSYILILGFWLKMISWADCVHRWCRVHEPETWLSVFY